MTTPVRPASRRRSGRALSRLVPSAFSCWGGMALRVAKDGRSDRIGAAVVWAIKGADAFRELLTVCQLAMVAARRAAPGKASHKRP
jgi:hypothetical protein